MLAAEQLEYPREVSTREPTRRGGSGSFSKSEFSVCEISKTGWEVTTSRPSHSTNSRSCRFHFKKHVSVLPHSNFQHAFTQTYHVDNHFHIRKHSILQRDLMRRKIARSPFSAQKVNKNPQKSCGPTLRKSFTGFLSRWNWLPIVGGEKKSL